MNIKQIAKDIVNREGGYSNNPADPGGPTNHGVTLATFQTLYPNKTITDLKQLTKAEAEQIFLTYYYKKPKIDLLPTDIQANVFDMYVNSGSSAIRILQRLLNAYGNKLTVDGILGPNTASIAIKIDNLPNTNLNSAYAVARRNYYFSLADARPSLRQFAMTHSRAKGGWIIRAEEFMKSEYRMSPLQFKQRVAKWQ